MSPTDPAARARAFFDARCPRAQRHAGWGEGDDSLVGGAFRQHHDEDASVAAARAFQRELHDAGLAWLTGPPELGGAGLGPEEVRAFWAVAAEYERPDLSALLVGQQIVAPAILQHGTPEQRQRWLPPIWRGDLIGCQLFSEPDAGSDLASLRTRAVRDGDGWRISGQKVWSSGARFSDIGELLARTDDDATLRHRGLTMFVIDMDAPGVSVRPLRQMTGAAHFCEVYLDDVLVDDGRRLGPVGAGWAVANTSLASERDGFGDADDENLFLRPYERLVELARHGDEPSPAVRGALTAVYVRKVIGELLPGHLAATAGAVAAAHPSLGKLHSTRADWELAQVAASLLGPAITADDGSWGHFAWSQVLLGVPAPRIAGGTDEIQRNITAERGLGLPRDAR